MVAEPSFYVHPWTVDDGTPDNAIMGTVRRADGYLWVVTRSGLFRFDGVKTQSVRPVSSAVIPGIVTPVLREDRRGRMWLTKDTGVIACVDGADIRLFTEQDGLPAPKPLSMAEDAEGAIWLSYYDAPSLCRIKDGKVRTLDATAADQPGQGLTVLTGDSRGTVWFARGHQVGVLRGERLLPLLERRQPVTGIAAGHQEGVWFSDGKQVWKYREGGTLESRGQVPLGNVNLLHEDERGRLWAATVVNPSSAMLFCDEGHGFRSVPIQCPYIVSLADDREGNLWVGTRRAGLFQVRSRMVEVVNPSADVPVGVRSVCEDRDGTRFAVYASVNLTCSQGPDWQLPAEPLGPAGRFCRVRGGRSTRRRVDRHPQRRAVPVARRQLLPHAGLRGSN